MSIKDKVLNIFFEEEIEDIAINEEEIKKSNKKYAIVSWSIVLNFIVNILYMNFICYRTFTDNMGFYFFVFSFIWAIVSIIASYKLGDRTTNNLFYVNVLLLFFLSKMWFVYM